MKWRMIDDFHCQSNHNLKSSPLWCGVKWRHTNDLVARYGTIHAIIRYVHKRTNRVRGNQTTQDLAGNDGRMTLTEKTNQNLLQCGRIIGMREETSMLAGVLEIRVKCGCNRRMRETWQVWIRYVSDPLIHIALPKSLKKIQKIVSLTCGNFFKPQFPLTFQFSQSKPLSS